MESTSNQIKPEITEFDTIQNESNDPIVKMVNKTRESIRQTIDTSTRVNKNLIKSIVSRNKFRFEYEGFDLDLSYITENIIAMGFPANNLEKFYRNGMSEVKRFFDKRHPNKYKVYNLCSERTYPENTFYKQAHYPFDDHQAPPINLILPFCKDVEDWLNQDLSNIASIHCKAGKGRTGTMICAYLLYSRFFNTADDVIRFYGLMRTANGKGVTIPSQLRYIYYFENILKLNIPHPLIPPTLLLSKIKMFGIPHQKCTPFFTVDNESSHYDYKLHNKLVKYKNEAFVELKLNNFSVGGDVKIEFYNKKTIGKEKLFSFWFNTYFVPNDGIFSIKKSMLDKAHKDKDNKIFESSFRLEIHYIILDENFDILDVSPLQKLETLKI